MNAVLGIFLDAMTVGLAYSGSLLMFSCLAPVSTTDVHDSQRVWCAGGVPCDNGHQDPAIVWTFIEVVTVATQAHHWRYNCLPEDLHALDFKPHVSTFDACLSCMSWSNMHVHMLPLHVRNEYACPHDTTPPCPDVKTHVWNLMFHNCMSNMHSEKNCMSTRYLFVKLHVHVAKCMSQNCHYANCMSNMQFKSELHVHNLKILMMDKLKSASGGNFFSRMPRQTRWPRLYLVWMLRTAHWERWWLLQHDDSTLAH